MKNTLKKITTLNSRGREFYIVRDENNKIWGIESKYIGTDGHLTKEINGCEGHLSETVSECVKNVMETIEIDYIAETTGCTKIEAIDLYFEQQIEEA